MERMEKINEQMKREISQMLQQEFEDPQFMLITVTGVKVTPDLRHARVRFSVLGDDHKINELQTRLDQSRGYFRRLIGRRIRLRYTPQIDFVYDPSVAQSARIEQALQEINREKERGPSLPDEPSSPNREKP